MTAAYAHQLACVVDQPDGAIGGLGHGGRAHSPDEYFVMRGKGTVAGMDLAEKHFATLLYRYAGK